MTTHPTGSSEPSDTSDPRAAIDRLIANPPEPFPDIDTARRKLEEIAGPVMAELAALRERTYIGPAGEEADDERVTAEVDGNGKLIGVQITYVAMRDFDASELSTACNQAIAAARTALADAITALSSRMPTFRVPSGTAPMSMDEMIRHAKEASGWQG